MPRRRAGGEADGLMKTAGGGVLARGLAQFSARGSTNAVINMFSAAWAPEDEQNPGYLGEQAGMAGSRALGVLASVPLAAVKSLMMS